MKTPRMPMITVATTLFVLASAASLAVDLGRGFEFPGLERTVTHADLCTGSACSIAYKTEDGGPPSQVVPVP